MFEPALPPDDPEPTPLAPPALDEHSLITLRRKLVKYAATRLAAGDRSTPFGRLQAEDLASDAILIALEILDGQKTSRTWDRNKTSMLGFCRGVVRSMASNNQTSAEVRSASDCAGDVTALGQSHSPRQVEAVEYGQLFELLVHLLSKDAMATRILKSVQAGEWISPQTFAETNDISENVVKAAWKKIIRYARKLTEIKDAP